MMDTNDVRLGKTLLLQLMADTERLRTGEESLRRRIDENRKESMLMDECSSKLSGLADTFSIDAWNVPLGAKAFFRGRLVHTNEVLVTLGGMHAWRTVSGAQTLVSSQREGLEKEHVKVRPCSFMPFCVFPCVPDETPCLFSSFCRSSSR